MTKKITVRIRPWAFGIAAFFVLAMVPNAFAQAGDIIKANIAFSFHTGSKTLPPGAYEFDIDPIAQTVSISDPKGGADTVEIYLTTLAPSPHSTATDAHLVFDKVGATYTLSEIWEPNADGILLYATKGKHEHEVVHVKK